VESADKQIGKWIDRQSAAREQGGKSLFVEGVETIDAGQGGMPGQEPFLETLQAKVLPPITPRDRITERGRSAAVAVDVPEGYALGVVTAKPVPGVELPWLKNQPPSTP